MTSENQEHYVKTGEIRYSKLEKNKERIAIIKDQIQSLGRSKWYSEEEKRRRIALAQMKILKLEGERE